MYMQQKSCCRESKESARLPYTIEKSSGKTNDEAIIVMEQQKSIERL